ncbi:catalase [Abditibacterium utsteinense]|uniref:Catalase n=1 Tax=Abditibacterium utsteinense TaxID=1960156 RepID=A0A2S8SPI5_9BACT|nr:catalase [Abditibacterium utsteinense]PQV62712.1 catalase [Abditibacterium utsteinense]
MSTPQKDSNTVANTAKDQQLLAYTTEDRAPLTNNMGQRISSDKDSLKAGKRGPTLLEDYILREKIQHFDHERIPERVVHARGAAAHGVFHLTQSLEQYTTAQVLTDTSLQTPVFVRFSTVAGSRGSADTARDVRGFAVKMYTEQGNWDIVGNNIPVFFIQDAIKFPDLIHAVKPEPNNEIPQASSAHDTFYDFISLTPESMHMIMWVMSDRGIPRSFSTMEGFGVHTFRLVNANNESHFVKFHWKPVAGVHSLVWDEAVKIAGQDPDFHRRSMWESIEAGNFFEWELGVQILPEADEEKFDFDVLDATKIWPEDLIPVQRVGKMTLNRNPDNYFSETEQVAFNTTNIIPGIDFSNDPLLQGRNFSYLDTQLSRLGSPNFHELPINRPVCPFSNNQRDAQMRHTINKGRVAYTPASLDGHSPAEERPGSGYNTFGEVLNGPKVRERAESFGDHYGQARLFWNSMAPIEKEHIVKALQFELSKVETREVRVRMLGHLQQINAVLAAQVALAIGEKSPGSAAVKPGGSADKPAEKDLLAAAETPTSASGGLLKTSGLSIKEGQPKVAKGRQVAILVAPGVSSACVETMQKHLAQQGVAAFVVAPFLGAIEGDRGSVEAKKTFANSSSVLFDAVYIPGGAGAAMLKMLPDARRFINEAFKHGKVIAATGEGSQLVAATTMHALIQDTDAKAQGVLLDENGNAQSVAADFVTAIAAHRFTNRQTDLVMA